MTTSPPCRPRDALVAIGRRYPLAWRQFEQFRAGRGAGGLPQWPDWCYCPLAAAYAVVSGGGDHRVPPHLMGDVARLGALAAWRVTQGIYRFDPAVYDAVRETPLGGDVPCEVLHRLPEWCVYLETPGLAWAGQPLHGVWAHLEWDAGTGREELRLLTDSDTGLLPIVLHLGQGSLAQALDLAMQEASRQATLHGGALAQLGRSLEQLDAVALLRPVVEPIVSLLLYVCSQAAEIGDGSRRPANPQPKRVKGGLRMFPADGPTTWEVGVRMGAALRRAYAAEETGQGAPHAGPRPHIRRAHWHGFWLGPRDGERRFDLRWLPPIAVNLDDAGDLAATVRAVKP